MKLNKIYGAYFSPGQTTKTMVTTIMDGFSDYPSDVIDLTDFDERQNSYSFSENDLLIIGVPAYAGRIPAPVKEALTRFHGSNTPAVIIASYGNRAVDDTLMELYHEIMDKGFAPVAAGTFVGQHTFLSDCAKGRPDDDDLKVLRKFTSELRERLRLMVVYDRKDLDIPGNYPYVKPPMGIFPFQVETNDYCIYCMLCAHVCPVQAIHPQNPKNINHSICLRCGSCIRVCPAQAKSFTKEPFEALQAKLKPLCNVRKEDWYSIG